MRNKFLLLLNIIGSQLIEIQQPLHKVWFNIYIYLPEASCRLGSASKSIIFCASLAIPAMTSDPVTSGL